MWSVSTAVMTNEMLVTDPHIAARGLFVDIDHSQIGRTRVMRQPWLFSDCAPDIRPGPSMGHDNSEVLSSILVPYASKRAELGKTLQ
jgi:crotonobetainyl-CoA:carnitine CoA-transferase CaiB-like acyl-CoA transferase